MEQKPKRYNDPAFDLAKQFQKLMYGQQVRRIKDKLNKDGTWTYMKNRYAAGNRIYQMQCDFMYLIKDVRERGRNVNDVLKCQEFINLCRTELATG